MGAEVRANSEGGLRGAAGTRGVWGQGAVWVRGLWAGGCWGEEAVGRRLLG